MTEIVDAYFAPDISNISNTTIRPILLKCQLVMTYVQTLLVIDASLAYHT